MNSNKSSSFGRAIGAVSIFIAALVPAIMVLYGANDALLVADIGLGLSGVAHLYGYSG